VRPRSTADRTAVGPTVDARWRDAALFLGGLGLVIGLHVVDPSERSLVSCPFRSITGLACPGCGTLRCLHAVLTGDLPGAVDLNALTVLVLPPLIAAWLLTGYRVIAPRPPTLGLGPAWLGRAISVAAGSFWVLRNLPWEPFRWLAP
jgi:hypothetical protein